MLNGSCATVLLKFDTDCAMFLLFGLVACFIGCIGSTLFSFKKYRWMTFFWEPWFGALFHLIEFATQINDSY